MKLFLTGVSQSVSFDQKDETKNLLDFIAEDGRKLSLEVPRDAVEKVLDFIHGEGPPRAAAPREPEPEVDEEELPPPVPEGASVFGEVPEIEEGDGDDPDVVHVPQTEAQVPSI